MSRRTMLITLLLCCVSLPATAWARDAFAGSWKVKISPDHDASRAGEKAFEDTLTFKGNQFTSEAFKKKGLGTTEYEEDTRAGIVATFKATSKSDTAGKAEWTGTAQGNEISGDVTVTKKDGTELKYTYKGEKK